MAPPFGDCTQGAPPLGDCLLECNKRRAERMCGCFDSLDSFNDDNKGLFWDIDLCNDNFWNITSNHHKTSVNAVALENRLEPPSVKCWTANFQS